MILFFVFKQKMAYDMRISDWSSDVCSSDLHLRIDPTRAPLHQRAAAVNQRLNAAIRPRTQAIAQNTQRHAADRGTLGKAGCQQIGRASGRERVWQYV